MMERTLVKSRRMQRSRRMRLKAALVRSFGSSAVETDASLAPFGAEEWRDVLTWLDISGIALYVFHRLSQLGLERRIPESLRSRLERNLKENRQRTEFHFAEACAISRVFDEVGIGHALLKGMTLAPDSVPECALRAQTDLDFLVYEGDALAAIRAAEGLSYGLHVRSGRTLEMRAGTLPEPDMENMYRVLDCRALEIHLLPRSSQESGDRLARAARRSFNGVDIPALASSDMLVQQAVHLFKHLCGEHTRLSWVLEFCNHVHAHHNEPAFWSEVELRAAAEKDGLLALGCSLYLTGLVFDDAFVKKVARRTEGHLSSGVRLWLETYGFRGLFASKPASKFYLLLRKELEKGEETNTERRRLLFPLRLPPPITRAEPGESLGVRFARYRIEIRYLLSRASFHVVEGLRYAVEASRWNRRMTGLI